MLRKQLSEVLRKNPSALDLRKELEEILSEIKFKLKPKAIVLAGSLAKGEFVRGMSDIDLLVIADKSEPRSMLRAVKDVNVEITIYTLEEVFHAIERGNQFIIDAIKNGIPLVGEDLIRRACMGL